MDEGALKRFFLGSLAVPGVLGLLERLGKGVPILAYHGVTARAHDPFHNRRRLHVPAALFERHLLYLRRHWRPVPLRSLIKSFAGGPRLDRRSVILTFDDGYRNISTVALPLLRRHEIPATLFVLTNEESPRLWPDVLETAFESTRLKRFEWEGTGYPITDADFRTQALRAVLDSIDHGRLPRRDVVNAVLDRLQVRELAPDDDRDLLDWDEVRRLHASGIDIGSHSSVHERLTVEPESELLAALQRSRERLERELGDGAFPLAYPYGAVNDAVCRASRMAGFSCGLTTRPGRNGPGLDPFRLKRALVGADDDIPRLRFSLSGFRGRVGA